MIDNKTPAALARELEALPELASGMVGNFTPDLRTRILTALSTKTPTLGERINIEIASISFAANPEAAYQRLGRTVAEHGAEIVEALSNRERPE